MTMPVRQPGSTRPETEGYQTENPRSDPRVLHLHAGDNAPDGNDQTLPLSLELQRL